jgi:energy-converting hydrogenase Eha subunit A
MPASRTLQLGMALLVLAWSPLGRAQDRVVIPLLTTSDWRLVKTESLDLAGVTGFGVDPAIEREYGVKKSELRHYQLGTRKAEALLEEGPDPTASYGLLTFYRTEELTPEKGLDMAFIGPSAALMARGRVCIRVRPAAGSALTRNELRALLIAIGGTRLSREESAYFPPPLPATGLIPHSEKYLLGLETARRVLPSFRTDLIGFTQGAEARVGTYTTGGGNSTVLTVNYPTPQIARVRFGAMESLLGINQEKGSGSIYGKRSGSYVFLVLNSSGSDAGKLLKEFQVASDVSWNEPAPQAERFAYDLAQLILSIIGLVLVIATVAVVVGVLVALSHRFAKRFFPESGWANPERDNVIRLNLQ